MAKKVLLIGGSLNQTTMMHAIAQHLQADCECFFSPYFVDTPMLRLLAKLGLLSFSVIGGEFLRQTQAFLQDHGLMVDYGGTQHDYDLVVTSSDLVIQRSIEDKPIVLVQEGMTDPENLMYYLVKWFGLPRYLASTSTTGLSDAYVAFCVACDGYRQLFESKGINPLKLVVTGIPNFDNMARFRHNDFPYRHYVLVATSDARETFKFDNRRRFIRRCIDIAAGRPMIFRLHPNENVQRATREIKQLVPDAMVYMSGNTEEMIANCDVLITQYSSVVYVGLALGKECYSYFDMAKLRQQVPWQNGGRSGAHIAAVCRQIIETGRLDRATLPDFAGEAKREERLGR